jgi:hypothetical protein
MSDPSEHEEGLKESNFDKSLAVLEHFVAGNIVNASLLKANQDVYACTRESGGREELQTMHAVYQMTKALNRSPGEATSCMSAISDSQAQSMFEEWTFRSSGSFWNLYQACEDLPAVHHSARTLSAYHRSLLRNLLCR